MRYEKTIIMRIPMTLYRNHLEIMDNYSEFCREAIEEKLERESNEQYLKALKKERQEQIKEIDAKLKASKEDTEGVKKILEMGFDRFKEHLDSPMPIASHFKSYLRADILPKLAKARCNRFDADSLLKMYYTGEITVGGEL